MSLFDKISAFIKTDFGVFLLIALGWQITMTSIGWLIAPNQGLLGHMLHWDAGWYQHIIAFAYSNEGSAAAPAFYPLFPFTVNALSMLSFGLIKPELSALLVNTVSLWLILVALWRILEKFHLPAAAKVSAVAAFITFPSAFFIHVFYSEALFITLAFWSYLFALNKNWRLVGILLALLTAGRLPAVLFIALCGLEYLRSYSWNIRKAFNKNLAWFALAPVGFLAYGLYLLSARGDFFAMFHAYSATNDWTYHLFNANIFATIYETAQKIVQSASSLHPTYEIFINYALPLAALILVLCCSIYLLKTSKQYGIPLFIFGLLSVVMFTLNSNVVSVHRYALVCLPVFIAMGFLARKNVGRYITLGACALSLAVQLFIYAKFINDIFAG